MMTTGEKVRFVIEPWLKNWSFFSLDLDGLSRGLISAWNPSLKAISSIAQKNVISVELEFKEFNMVWKVLNVNGPYADRNSFWDNMLVSGIMPHSPFILGGDMNFTSSISEVREDYPRSDPSKAYFIHYFEALHLVNVKPIKLAPTWQNLCSPEDAVSKRLDRFFVS